VGFWIAGSRQNNGFRVNNFIFKFRKLALYKHLIKTEIQFLPSYVVQQWEHLNVMRIKGNKAVLAVPLINHHHPSCLSLNILKLGLCTQIIS